MDFELILYLVFLALALLSRLFTKKKEPPKSNPKGGSQSEPPKNVKSFEELLEEFTGEKSTQKREPREPDFERREEFDEREAREYSRKDFQVRDERKERETYETSFEFESSDKLKTIDELVDIEKTRTTTKLQPEEAEEETPESAEILSLLQSADDARRAIILSEIIGRKY